MYNEVITLVGEVVTVNALGDQVVVETGRDVFAELKSITQSEFYQAAAVGFKPELKFVLADFLDYHGEDKLKYTAYGTQTELTYKIIRTYRNDHRIELICKKDVEE